MKQSEREEIVAEAYYKWKKFELARCRGKQLIHPDHIVSQLLPFPIPTWQQFTETKLFKDLPNLGTIKRSKGNVVFLDDDYFPIIDDDIELEPDLEIIDNDDDVLDSEVKNEFDFNDENLI